MKDTSREELQTEIELLKRTLDRERKAREKAEDLLDSRSSVLYDLNQKLQRQYESAAKQASEITFLKSVTDLVHDDLKLEHSIETFLTLVCELCKWPVGHAFFTHLEPEIELKSAKLWYLADHDRFTEFKRVTQEYVFKPGKGLPGRVYESGGSLWIVDVTQDGNFPRANLLSQKAVVCGFGVPIKINDKVIAVAEFYSSDSMAKDHGILKTVEVGAVQLGMLLEKQLAQKRMRENYEHLKQTQMQLIQSEKMASLGTIAAGVAHEINNPISFVLSNTETLSTYCQSMKKVMALYQKLESACQAGQSQDAQSVLSEIATAREKEDLEYLLKDSEPMIKETLEGVFRVKEIVQGLKSFSRVDEVETKGADINECIESTLKVLANELKYKCVIEKRLNPLPQIVCYPGQLIQVFTNLLLNSAQAIKDRGVIRIESSFSNGKIQLKFSDNGHGIAPENIKNIFTPFFTTKPVGKGTGLGLSISYGIIKKHDGEITVQSKPGDGTTFTIELPVREVK